MTTPWSSVGYLVFKRTYARRFETRSGGKTEEWTDAVERCVRAIQRQLKAEKLQALDEFELARLRNYLLNLKCSLAGRFLWQLGTRTVDRLGLSSLQNCAFVPITHHSDFCFIFDFLMLGCGVGFSVASRHISYLPKVREDFKIPIATRTSHDADYIVPDSREGWVSLLSLVLESAFSPIPKHRTGSLIKPGFTYSTVLIRSKGAPISGFGGVASGPDILIDGIDKISRILYEARGRKLTSVECLDIACIIGSIVVAGNVRRSALISIGDATDIAYLSAKRWDLGHIPAWRAMVNSSVYCSSIDELPDAFWEGYYGNGEPYGLINIDLAQNQGRIGEYRYDNCEGFNPCAEQCLAPYETCCLAEIFLPRIESKEELFDIATLLYKVCKLSLMLPCHNKDTEEIVHKNMRMGIGVTGYLQSSEEQKSWLRECYVHLREFDNHFSTKLGVLPSIRLTTVKPSGTLSLLPGVTPGVHPAYSQYVIRRVRFSADDPLVELVKEHGYHVEPQVMLDGSIDHTTVVAEFPMSYPEGTPTANDLSPIDQLRYVERLRMDWSDNSVSCTIYFDKDSDDVDRIRKFLLDRYSNRYKSLSFLPKIGHGFPQAPLEAITKERYEEIVSKTKPITEESVREFYRKVSDQDSFSPITDECDNGSCPIR
ncbi:MAG: hypothetical protein QW328_07015 [Nitrososphaerota archaeon]